MRHSLAHILAAAVKKHWPEAKFGIGPVVAHGFYYDIDLGAANLSSDDLVKIEAAMRELIAADLPFERFELPLDEALQREKAAGQSYKVELLAELKAEGVKKASYYRSGDFEDLCQGPHVKSTGQVGAFKLHKVAGAYWRGDERKPMLTRVYGLAFETKKELEAHLKQLTEAQARDHRKLGQELGLFTFSDLVGSGLPLFTPKGTWLRELLGRYSQQIRAERGFERVWIPHLTKTDLYKTSGHWDKFGEELLLVNSRETSDDLALKPMNCPHHGQIYAAQPRSYRDLPVRYMENTAVYRDEKSGELHGLSRVRAITQDDSHVYCRADQLETEVLNLVDAAKELYKQLRIDLKFNLSFRDESDKWLGGDQLWQQAQATLEQIARKEKLDYTVAAGEAAFYGPKIDFIATDALGREWQVATVQLDFVQPQRLDLEYTDEQNRTQTPVLVHAALLGSIERFLAIYIEHTAGRFPFWLAPEQVRILAINEASLQYAEKVANVLNTTIIEAPLQHNALRYSVDARNESLAKKVRAAELAKVPVLLIVGPQDAKAQQVSARTADGETKVKLAALPEWLKEQR